MEECKLSIKLDPKSSPGYIYSLKLGCSVGMQIVQYLNEHTLLEFKTRPRLCLVCHWLFAKKFEASLVAQN
jgi:hypothetical protein